MIQQVIVQLAAAIDLAAAVLGAPDQLRLPSIFPSPLAQRALLPSIVATRLYSEAPTHCPHAETIAMLGNERASHFASRAKYAVVFWNVALLGHPGQFPPSPDTCLASSRFHEYSECWLTPSHCEPKDGEAKPRLPDIRAW